MSARSRRRNGTGSLEWSRARLLVVLAASVAVAVAVVAGLGLAVYYSLHHPAPSATGTRPGAVWSTSSAPTGRPSTGHRDDQARRDALAEQPMPSLPPSAAIPTPLSIRTPPVIVLPAATRTGPAGVPTGFPHTPAGALAQLAAVDVAAMQPASLDAARAVIAVWAAPGGPTQQNWSGVKAIGDFLTAAGLSGGGAPQLALTVTPMMGLIKGTVGPDFAVVCVDYEFDATLDHTFRVAIADCQRMVWAADRWVVGPGSEPYPAPSVWPDTDNAIDVGYADLRRG